jgi:hypothetical protein
MEGRYPHIYALPYPPPTHSSLSDFFSFFQIFAGKVDVVRFLVEQGADTADALRVALSERQIAVIVLLRGFS